MLSLSLPIFASLLSRRGQAYCSLDQDGGVASQTFTG